MQRLETSLEMKEDIILGQKMYCRHTVELGATSMTRWPVHQADAKWWRPWLVPLLKSRVKHQTHYNILLWYYIFLLLHGTLEATDKAWKLHHPVEVQWRRVKQTINVFCPSPLVRVVAGTPFGQPPASGITT